MAKKTARQFTMKPAKREAMDLRLGVSGPSSSGKTYTSLLLGVGIQEVVGGDLALVDTENGRANQYADEFKFLHVPFAAPFGSLAYLDALNFVAGKGVKTCIIDSMSHEHEGDGGHLHMHEAELDRMAGDDWGKRKQLTFLAWAKPAAERRAFLNAIQQIRMNLIFCFRAKDKLALVKVNGKTEAVSIGWQPIAGPEFVFEMTALVVLPPRSGGVPDWKAEAVKVAKGWDVLFPKAGVALDKATGERLARYAQGEKVKPVGDKIAPLQEDARRTTAAALKAEQKGGKPSEWSPMEGWPEFKTVSEWAKWSIQFLTNKEIGRTEAEAWSEWWRDYMNNLEGLVQQKRTGAAEIDKELKAALNAAMKREAKLL